MAAGCSLLLTLHFYFAGRPRQTCYFVVLVSYLEARWCPAAAWPALTQTIRLLGVKLGKNMLFLNSVKNNDLVCAYPVFFLLGARSPKVSIRPLLLLRPRSVIIAVLVGSLRVIMIPISLIRVKRSLFTFLSLGTPRRANVSTQRAAACDSENQGAAITSPQPPLQGR